MCPHCLLAAAGAAVVSIRLVPASLRFIKGKFSRQEAMRENFSVLYGKPDLDRANPGYKSFQKGMGDTDAT